MKLARINIVRLYIKGLVMKKLFLALGISLGLISLAQELDFIALAT